MEDVSKPANVRIWIPSQFLPLNLSEQLQWYNGELPELRVPPVGAFPSDVLKN